MFELEQAAEEHLRNALAAVDRGELAAQKEVQRWTMTVDNIRRMRASVARMSDRSFGMGPVAENANRYVASVHWSPVE